MELATEGAIVQVTGVIARSYGGPAEAVQAYAESLVVGGAQNVHVFATTAGLEPGEAETLHARARAGGFSLRLFPCLRGASGWTLSPRLVRALVEMKDLEFVHIHSPYGFHGLGSACVAAMRRIPYAYRPHGAFTVYHRSAKRMKKAPYEWLIERRIAAKAAFVHCTSERERSEFLDLAWNDKVVVVPLPVASSAPRVDRSDFAVFVGRLTTKKQPILLAEAVGTGRSWCKRVVFAGPIDEDIGKSIVELACRSAPGTTFDMLGTIGSEERDRLLGTAAVFVLPSLEENFGLAPVEAAAAGAPVVATAAVDSMAPLFASGAAVECTGTVDGVVEALNLLADHERRAEVGEAGRLIVKELYDPLVVGAALLREYRTP